MHMNHRARWALAALIAVLAFISFTVAGWAGDPKFNPTSASLSPVTGGEDVLYTATFPYIGSRTLTHPEVRITFPADWTYAAPADPNVCQLTSATSLTCVRQTVKPGDPPVTQAVRFKTTAVTTTVQRTVSSIFTYAEQASQGDNGRADNVAAPDAKVDVDPPNDNSISTCAAKNGGTVSTKQGVSETNKLTTTMILPATAALCSPASAKELPPNDPSVAACPPGVTCTAEIAITNAPLFTAAKPIKLIFEMIVKPKNWYKNGQLPAVPNCKVMGGGTADPDPCITKQENLSKGGQRLTVNWSGLDPRWTG